MTTPIDFYYWPTPNGWKVSILLEELGLPYNLHLVDIGAGDQFTSEFTKISPNQRMPAIVDHISGPQPVSVFESGPILIHLAKSQRRFLPIAPYGEKDMLEWLFWQAANLGPMGGQHSHFWNYAPETEKSGYAANRYRGEYIRCIGVLERWLSDKDYILGTYTIADMMNWPWILIAKAMGVPLDPYPNVTAWRQRVKERPAVQRGVALAKDTQRSGPLTDDVRRTLFPQGGERDKP